MATLYNVLPLGAIPFEKFQEIRLTVYTTLVNEAAKVLKADPKNIVVRDIVVGDSTNAADWVDLSVKTAIVAGQQFWGQSASDLTSNQLSSILAAGERIDDNKLVAFFGWVDLTPNPDLVKIRFKKGQEIKAVWYAEHVYAWKEVVGGVAQQFIIYYPKDPIDIQMEFKDGSTNKYVALFGFIAELAGEQISAPK